MTRRLVAVLSVVLLAGCSGTTTPTSPSTGTSTSGSPGGTSGSTPPATGSTLASVYSQFGNGVQVSLDGTMVRLTTTSVPDHTSPYFGIGDPRYEAPHAGMQLAPNRIVAQTTILRVPASPAVGSATDTPLGPIGVAINGVVFFNQYAAMRQPLTQEILTFDRFHGHPSPTNQYHYHIEPLWLTGGNAGRFIGVLLDGFPVYGPREADGALPSALDTCNGHVHPTPDFPAGLYHYHVVPDPPYISGCFRGARGTVG